jgi:hypothetical protein
MGRIDFLGSQRQIIVLQAYSYSIELLNEHLMKKCEDF